MKIIAEINNVVEAPLKKDFFEAVAKKTLKELNYNDLKNKNFSISIAIVGKSEIRKLNKKYRKKDESTDILSFAEYNNINKIKKDKSKNIFLGEIILCYTDIKGYAKKEGMDAKKMLPSILAHGILHLLGFKHGKKMFEIQDVVSSTIKK